MSYSSPADVRAILIKNGRDAPSTGATDLATPASFIDSDLQDTIDEADSVIDASLSQVYLVPFDPVPEIILAISAGIAQYLATMTYRKTTDIPLDDPSRLRYRYARDLLDRLVAGTMTLDADPAVLPGGAVYNVYDGNLFAMRDFSPTERRLWR